MEDNAILCKRLIYTCKNCEKKFKVANEDSITRYCSKCQKGVNVYLIQIFLPYYTYNDPINIGYLETKEDAEKYKDKLNSLFMLLEKFYSEVGQDKVLSKSDIKEFLYSSNFGIIYEHINRVDGEFFDDDAEAWAYYKSGIEKVEKIKNT